MRKLAFAVIISLVLSACQSDADRLVFTEAGTVFTNGDSFCIGKSGEADALNYYYLEEIVQGINKPLLNSGDVMLNLYFPDNCFKINLNPGSKYGVLYIMNDIKYRYEFDVDKNGTIDINKKRS
ncbi:hypothetical protein AAH450_03210 [Erwinia sp. P7711]|uniref:hypothetical protein n=1 Tax=Erwinia sp. P7711 TaxID=3141451 RepID=UPI00319AF271